MTLHGAQSNAQKSTTTTLPLNELSLNGPSELIRISEDRNSGAFSPAGDANKCAARASMPAVRRRVRHLMLDILLRVPLLQGLARTSRMLRCGLLGPGIELHRTSYSPPEGGVAAPISARPGWSIHQRNVSCIRAMSNRTSNVDTVAVLGKHFQRQNAWLTTPAAPTT